MTTHRWPAIVVLLAALVGALAYDAGSDPAPVAPPTDATLALERSTPHVIDVAAGSERWFCAAGTASADGIGDHRLLLSNVGTEPLVAVVTVVVGSSGSVRTEIEVPPAATRPLTLRSVAEGEWVAAVVESVQPGLLVEHRLVGATGSSVASCASTPAGTWRFAAGTTASDARSVIAVLNPFPDDAVLDVTVETEDGTRVPTAFQGVVVAGGAVVALPVKSEVPRRDQVSVVVEARSGRVVAERLQLLDGSEGRTGLAASLGSAETALTWVFPFARTGPTVGERYVVLNPADEPAGVDVELRLDDPERLFDLEPFELVVEPGRYASVDLADEGERVPPGTPHDTIVQGRNGVGIVAEQVLEGDGVLAIAPGIPVQATTWFVPQVPDAATTIGIVNVGVEGIATLTVEVLEVDGWRALDELADLEVGPGRRLLLRGDDLPPGTLRIVASAPVVVGRRVVEGSSVSNLGALPQRGTSSAPEVFG